MKRRDLLLATLATAPLAALTASQEIDFPGILDSNVHLGRWPFRRLPLDETGKLVARLRALGVTRALAGSYEGIFHRDLGAANARLVEECAAFPELVPVPAINPGQSGWRGELEPAPSAVRLYPAYHGYGLEHPGFTELLQAAAARDLLVQVVVAVEDPRTQPDRMRVPELDLAPLPEVMSRVPEARVQLLNWNGRGPLTNSLKSLPGLSVDTALADGTDAVARLVEAFGADGVLFGSHAPFLIPEAALVRVHEGDLAEEVLLAILHDNAARLCQTGPRVAALPGARRPESAAPGQGPPPQPAESRIATRFSPG